MLIVFYCTSFHGNSCPTTKYVLLHLTTPLPLQKCNVMTGSNCGPTPPVPQTTWDFNYFPKLWQHGAKSRFITISGIFPRALSLRRDCANFLSFLPPSRSRHARNKQHTGNRCEKCRFWGRPIITIDRMELHLDSSESDEMLWGDIA